MSYRETDHLRVLIANERKDRLALVAPIVAALGHEVIAREIDVEDVGPVTARERPDVALVGLGESSDHALGLIEKIVKEAACPVIVLHPRARSGLRQGGVKARRLRLHHRRRPTDWQSSIDIVLRRFAEYHDLEGAFGRRAVTERAKGILMERHSIDEPAAFDMLRDIRARRTGSSSTSPPQSWTATACYRSSRRPHLRRLADHQPDEPYVNPWVRSDRVEFALPQNSAGDLPAPALGRGGGELRSRACPRPSTRRRSTVRDHPPSPAIHRRAQLAALGALALSVVLVWIAIMTVGTLHNGANGKDKFQHPERPCKRDS